MVKVKYTSEFTINKGRIAGVRVLREEFATDAQKEAIGTVKPMLRQFIKSRLSESFQDIDKCTILVHVSYVETAHGLQIAFKL